MGLIKLFEAFSHETEGLWYHGDMEKLTTFSGRHLDVKDYSRDRNAWGPGVYFTRLEYQARGYAEGANGHLYTCQIDVEPKRLLHDKTRVNRAKVLQFIRMAPDREMLYNFDEDLDRAEIVALNGFCDAGDMHSACMMAYNDLYQRDYEAFAKSMIAIGYDAIYHQVNPKYEPDAIHLVVWNTDIIKILKVEKIG